MRSFVVFLKNISFLTKYKLSEIKNNTEIAKNGLDFIKYEIKDDLETLFVPVILNFKDTIDHIIKHNLSVSRFGDGEFTLMQGGKICFQDQDKKLAKRLKEILTSPQNPGF